MTKSPNRTFHHDKDYPVTDKINASSNLKYYIPSMHFNPTHQLYHNHQTIQLLLQVQKYTKTATMIGIDPNVMKQAKWLKSCER